MSKANWEEKFLFRLVKVVYVLALLVSIFLVAVEGWYSRPISYVDDDKSTLSCDNGRRYTLSSVRIYIYSTTEGGTLDASDDRHAKVICAYGIVDDSITRYNLPSTNNYKVNYVYSVRGSWQSALLWWIGGFLGVYIVLNLMREALNYIFVGRPFQLDWLRKNRK